MKSVADTIPKPIYEKIKQMAQAKKPWVMVLVSDEDGSISRAMLTKPGQVEIITNR